MKTLEISGTLRKDLGKKSSKELRKNNNVPCVIYGGKENVHFSTHENNLSKLVYTPDAHLVMLNVEGKKYEAVLKEIQFHPVTDKMLHIDFTEVSEDKPITIGIPIKVSGDSAGVKAGGKLRIRRRSLLVKGLAINIPEFIPIDITELKIHESVKIGDLTFENFELVEPKKSMILQIATSRVAQKEEETPAEGAEGAAPAAEGAPEEEKK
ncbi:MAG TPA: 50S ribosomal protein L25/general stress protein Ctc [Bacteroidales bacterium]|nr:50S ribosomal protein L25/general stress protein Ctc [Bacteroidales bacterium]